jgi:cell division protein ZipA
VTGMELRLILFLIGAVIVAAIYFLSRQKSAGPPPEPRAAPTLGNLDLDDDLPAGDDDERRVPVREQGEQLILALHVTPHSDAQFSGIDVLEALKISALQFGRYQVFHRLEGAGEDAPSVFSVANMLEPGTLDLKTLPEMTLPGLTLFMVLPGPRNGVAAYADMLATARRLAQQLDGEVLDETRSTLTRQTAHHIRERIIGFEHQQRLRRSP